MKKLIVFLGFDFELMQYKFGRKYLKGTFYETHIQGLGLWFWTDQKITSCQAKVIGTEVY